MAAKLPWLGRLGLGHLQKITHEWLQTWRPSHSRLLRVQWPSVRTRKELGGGGGGGGACSYILA